MGSHCSEGAGMVGMGKEGSLSVRMGQVVACGHGGGRWWGKEETVH